MIAPKLLPDEISSLLENCEVVGKDRKGGQKQVFPVRVNGGEVFALKIIEITDIYDDVYGEDIENLSDEASRRARREVNVLTKCNSPYIIKPGPIDTTLKKVGDKVYIYFSEKWINGVSLKDMADDGKILGPREIVKLGTHITKAIAEIWVKGDIHRDIKPGNIMFCEDTKNFILLDMGFVLDLDDESITADMCIPGTLPYMSPEQLAYTLKRELDFRSDIFSLGDVLYELSTGAHPFWKRGMPREKIMEAILKDAPVSPRDLNKNISIELSNTILRMLNKEAHLRFRSCEMLISKFEEMLI